MAQELAIRHPEKVRSLVLASTHAGSNAWRKAVIESWIIARRVIGAGRVRPGDDALAGGPAVLPDGQAQVEGLVRFAERNEWPQVARRVRAPGQGRHRARCPRAAWVRSASLAWSCPASSTWSTRRRSPASWPKGCPTARLVVLPGVGHLPHIEDGPGFREAIGDVPRIDRLKARLASIAGPGYARLLGRVATKSEG